ncbi:MAG TPA: HD-GYP domain-containing protein [Firmicutes bacterium]|nr:HD-GYP domain-containing protein [Bacillota bacterium]
MKTSVLLLASFLAVSCGTSLYSHAINNHLYLFQACLVASVIFFLLLIYSQRDRIIARTKKFIPFPSIIDCCTLLLSCFLCFLLLINLDNANHYATWIYLIPLLYFSLLTDLKKTFLAFGIVTIYILLTLFYMNPVKLWITFFFDTVVVLGLGYLFSILFDKERNHLRQAHEEISKSHAELTSAYNQLKAYTEVLEFTTHELDRKTLNISAINTLTHILSTRQSIDLLTTRISSFLCKTFSADRAHLLFLETGKEIRVYSYFKGKLNELWIPRPDRRNWFYISLFEAARSIMLKKEEIINLEKEIFWTTEVPRNLVGIPLFRTEGIFGAIILSNMEEQLFREDINLLQIMAGQVSIALERIRMYNNLEENYLATIKALASSIEAKDPYTRGHSERVTKLSLLLGELMGLSSNELLNLKYGGLLHDIGKIGVSELILNKPGSLSAQEFNVIQKHPVIGADIVTPVSFLQGTLPLIRHHHERYDGSGYPDHISSKELPLSVRILTICDAFDAMSSDRPYRKALPLSTCIEELKNKAGSQFDPEIVSIFTNLLAENPALVFD